MAPAAVAQGLLTFAFTDIVGSTQLWERVPEAARQAVARHYEIVRDAVSSNHGTIFKTVGDACCCVFDAPVDAVNASIAIQRGLESERWPKDAGSLRVRIGIHSGPAIVEAGDYFGPTLNRVARLTSAAHGGQILVSAATAQAVRESAEHEFVVTDLGAHRLRDLGEPQHIFQIGAAGLPQEFPPPASLDAHPNNLPSQLSTFIGRREEFDRLREMLSTSRLVTISGSGGVGKTRLALQAAAETIAAYADGSWIVRFEDISDPSLVAHAIASTLGVSAVAGEPLQQTLGRQLRERRTLLILDNAEHVLAATADIARRLLSDCPALTILITSREPVHIAGEQVLRIGRMVSDDAARLFVSRANLSRDDAYVRHICDELDGLPLAIELAAGRIGTLTTSQLDARLQDMLPVLASKDRSQESRHRTLQATIEWSYRLLNPKEQRFFAWLSVFAGGFTLEACEAVAWAGEEDDPAYELLDALVDKSFVSAEPAGDSMRYRLLEVLHRFAATKLRESSDEGTARALHFDYFKALAERWGSWQSSEEEQAYISSFAHEIPNVRAALEWGVEREDPVPAFELLLKVALYWQQHCSIAEARAWLTRACSKAGGHPTVLHAKLLRRAATFATIEDDYAAARTLTEEALAMFRELGDLPGTAEALHNLAVIEQRSGSEDEAYRLYREALSIFERTGHEIGTITALYNLAQTCKRRGDSEAAKDYLERGMSLCTSVEHADRLATFWMLRAELAMQERAFDQARAALEQAIEMKRALDDRHDQVEVLCNFAVLQMRLGESESASRYARDALALARELDVPSLIIASFEVNAAVLLNTGHAETAKRVYAAAKALRSERGYVYGILDEIARDLARLSNLLPIEKVTRADVERVMDELAGDYSLK